MKSYLLIIALMLVAFGANAQQKPALTSKTPEQKADEIVTELTTDLTLTEYQIPKVKAITLERVNKNTAAFKKIGPNDRARLEAANKLVLTEWETQLKEILTKEQWNKYIEGR